MLKESLQTLRSIHLLIFGVIFATLLFALSSNPKQIAYQQLQQLGSLYEASAVYSDYRNENITLSRKYLNKSVCFDAAKNYLSPKNIDVIIDDKIRRTSKTSLIPNRLSTHAFFSDETLDVIKKRILRPVFLYEPDVNSLAQEISESKFSSIPENSSIRLNSNIDYSYGYYKYPTGHQNVSDSPMWACSFTFETEAGLSYFHVDFDLKEQGVEIDSWAKWLYNQPEFKSMVKFKDNKYSVFSYLESDWYEFGPLTVGELDQRLKDRLKNKQDALQVFGFNIAPSSALLVSPLLMFLSLLYFTTHVSHVLTIAGDDEASLNSFPWIGIYKDKTGTILTYLSLNVLPVVSLVVLLINTTTSNLVVYYAAVILTVLVALTGSYAGLIVFRLRSLVLN